MVQRDTVWRNEDQNNACTCSSWRETRYGRQNYWIFWKRENKHQNAQLSRCCRHVRIYLFLGAVSNTGTVLFTSGTRTRELFSLQYTIQAQSNAITLSRKSFLISLTVSPPLTQFYAFYGNQIFVTLFPEALYFSLFWAKLIDSTNTSPPPIYFYPFYYYYYYYYYHHHHHHIYAYVLKVVFFVQLSPQNTLFISLLRFTSQMPLSSDPPVVCDSLTVFRNVYNSRRSSLCNTHKLTKLG